MQYYTEEMVAKYSEDPFDLLGESQDLVHQQLAKELYEHQGNYHIDCLLDVAIGLGKSFVQAAEHFEIKECIGNDYSEEMLKQAQKAFPNFTPIHGDCVDIDKHVAAASVDVVYAHYVLSYVNALDLFKSINTVLKPGGYISIATSTWDNLRDAQDLIQQALPFIFNREKFIKRYKGMIPFNSEHVLQMLRQCGFEDFEVGCVKKEITFTTFNEFWAYFAEAGWHVQSARITGRLGIDKFLWRAGLALLSLYTKKLKPPITVTTNLCVVTARKLS
jgi:ubiquinone/menaquinone biosynthesis C-methylase UbiE